MTKYDAIFIGGNNSNLIAALRLAKNGYKVLMLEKNHIPGGCSTSFIRGRFEFDASLQELYEYGSTEEPGLLYKLFQSLDLNDQIRFADIPNAFHVYVSSNHENYKLPFGLRNFIDKMEEYVSDSRESLEKFFQLGLECRNALKYIGKHKANTRYEVLLSDYPHFMKIANSSVSTVLNAINMPRKAQEILTANWSYFGSPIDTLSFVQFASTFYSYIARGTKIPRKTSFEISLVLAESIVDNGGYIKYLSTVEEILFENDKVSGVKLSNGDIYEAPYIICGVSPNEVYGKMIPSKYIPKNALKLTNSRVLGGRGFAIYLGLNQSAKEIGLNDYSYIITNTLDSRKEYEKMGTTNVEHFRVSVINNANIAASPKNTCIMQFSTFFTNDCFMKLANPSNYYELKEQIANRLITLFEDTTGIIIKPFIEEIEISSPETFARYTNQPEGTIYGFKATGLDNLLPRMINEEKEQFIDNLKFNSGFGTYLSSYATTYLTGNELAMNILASREGVDANE